MRTGKLGVALAAAFIFASAAAFAQTATPPNKTAETNKGTSLVDSNGMTLYVFDKDVGGKSACNGQCAVNWPPALAPADAKPISDYTVVKRDDGGMQWAYKGKPLYTWKNDKKAGDATGDGMANNTWHVATP